MNKAYYLPVLKAYMISLVLEAKNFELQGEFSAKSPKKTENPKK